MKKLIKTLTNFYNNKMKPLNFVRRAITLAWFTFGLFLGTLGTSTHTNSILNFMFKVKLLLVGFAIQVGFSNWLLILFVLSVSILLSDHLPVRVRINKYFICTIKCCLGLIGWIITSLPFLYFSVQFKLADKQVLQNIYFNHPNVGDPQVLLYYITLGLYTLIIIKLALYFLDNLYNAQSKRIIKETIKDNSIPKFPSNSSMV